MSKQDSAKARNRRLSKKCKQQRDYIREMIEFMDEQGIEHDFKVPEEENLELEDARVTKYEINGETKKIVQKKPSTFMGDDELVKRLNKLTNKRQRNAS